MSREHTYTESDRALLSARVDHFHDDLGKGSVDDWEKYLLRLPKALRRLVLVELAIVHIAFEWRARRRPRVEDYLDRFPELGPADRVPEALVLEEYRCHLTARVPADPGDYARRFPHLFPAAMEKLRAVEREVSDAPPSDAARLALPLRGHVKVTVLGGGAFADVWLVRNANGQEKALKIVRDKMTSEAAQRELKALEQVKNLRHKCLLSTEDYWIENQQLHIVSELAEGSLKGRMEQCQREEGLPGIPAEELFGYLLDAARGLDFLHRNHITHRDVKPDNILLVSGGAVVADFGLVRQQASLMTQQSVFAGTMPYMAPELFGGEGGPPSDQYALALTYIHLRQGVHPLKMLPYPQMMMQHVDGQYELADHVTPAERAALMKALDPVPTKRHASCQDFARAIAEALGLPYLDRRQGKSGAQPIPAPRGLSSEAPVLLRSTVAKPPVGSIASPGTGTHVKGSTVERVWKAPTAEHAVPVLPPPPFKLLPLVVVGVLVLALGGLIALALSGGGGGEDTPPATQPTPPTVPTPPTNTGNGNGGKPTPETAPPPRLVEDRPLMPAGTTQDGTEIENGGGGRKYARWVTGGMNAERVRFRYIPAAVATGGKLVGPFYLMEEKVSNRLYSAAGDGPDATAPAVGMTRAEAEAFAKRLHPEGRLPTPEEWDAATGFFAKPRPASLTKVGTPIVDAAKPAASRKDTQTADESAFGLLDMAGNGGEWTAGTLPGDPPRAITRGRNFLLRDPLTFEVLTKEQTEPKASFTDRGNKYTGFRVLIPAPAGK